MRLCIILMTEVCWSKPQSSFLLFSLVFSCTLYVVAGYIDETLCFLILQKQIDTIW